MTQDTNLDVVCTMGHHTTVAVATLAVPQPGTEPMLIITSGEAHLRDPDVLDRTTGQMLAVGRALQDMGNAMVAHGRWRDRVASDIVDAEMGP